MSPISPGSGTPQGGAQLLVDGTPVESIVQLDQTGRVSISTSAMTAGQHEVSLEYGGSSRFVESIGELAGEHSVGRAPTSTTVTVTSATGQYSDQATFVATISPGSVNGLAPATGVTFMVGSQALGSAPLVADGAVLTATLTDVPLLEPTPYGAAPTGQMAPGTHAVTGVFGGLDPNFEVADATSTLMIRAEDARTSYTGPTSVATSSPAVRRRGGHAPGDHPRHLGRRLRRGQRPR